MMGTEMTDEGLAHVAEVKMDQVNGNRAIPRCACHSLEGPGPYITGHKNAWDAGFQGPWIAIKRPSVGFYLASSQDKTHWVACNAFGKPLAMRGCPNENEERISGNHLLRSRLLTCDTELFKLICA